MKQPRKSKAVNKEQPKTKKTTIKKTKANNHHHKHPQYGTSKLEEDFAHEFLDKLGIEYQYQYEAKSIGRFFDFYLPKSNIIIEIDGDYWHGNKEIYKEEELKGFQKRAQRVDEYKTRWALSNGIPIIRFWEHDIRKNPNKVLTELKERLYIEDKKIEKKRRHRKIL